MLLGAWSPRREIKDIDFQGLGRDLGDDFLDCFVRRLTRLDTAGDEFKICEPAAKSGDALVKLFEVIGSLRWQGRFLLRCIVCHIGVQVGDDKPFGYLARSEGTPDQGELSKVTWRKIRL